MENKGLLFLGSVYDVINGDVATTTRSLAGLGNKRSSTPKTAMQEQDSFPWMKFRNKCIAAAGGAHMMSERETISYTRLKSFLHKDTSFHSPWSWEPNVPMLLLRIMKLQVHQEE
ncbi:hypothetical protein JHK85_011051 [Glycine max]|nr:hypothetical protein JHK85_011051 [Glycine max]